MHLILSRRPKFPKDIQTDKYFLGQLQISKHCSKTYIEIIIRAHLGRIWKRSFVGCPYSLISCGSLHESRNKNVTRMGYSWVKLKLLPLSSFGLVDKQFFKSLHRMQAWISYKICKSLLLRLLSLQS